MKTKSFLKALKNTFFPGQKWNIILDKELKPASDDELLIHFGNTSNVLHFSESQYSQWLRSGGLGDFICKPYIHKKALEFFFSMYLLEIAKNECILDAAGGNSVYLQALQKRAPKHSQFITDHIYRGVYEREDGVTVAGGDISAIQLPAQSIDKIACHHAFEHFQGDRDMQFICETGRLLRRGGRACITPLFIADKYAECWNIDKKNKFDNDAELLIDESSSLPGGDEDGHFARIYSIPSFKKRILDIALNNNLSPTIVTFKLDGENVPDMNKNFGARINNPLRALLLEKV